MSPKVIHDAFVIERSLTASRQRAFEVWSNPDLKAKWFVGPAGIWTQVIREQDFAVGGKEIVRGAFSQGGTSHFEAVYMDIIDQSRIVYAYRMFVDDELMSVSLATVEFKDSETGTHMTFTEQGAFFTSKPGVAHERKRGSEMLLDNIVRFLEETK
jgi:uncharacterized protein YndB with AHSA1/START domain